jgi:hypothetical protein
VSEEHDVYLDGEYYGDLSMLWHHVCEVCFANEDFYLRQIKDAHDVVRKNALEWYEDETRTIGYLLAPVAKVRRRMHVQGFSADNVLALWNREYPKHIALLEEMRDKHGIEGLHTDIFEQKGLSFKEWLDRAKKLPTKHLMWRAGVSEFELTDPLAGLALEIDHSDHNVLWTEIGSYAEDFDPELSFHENFSRANSFEDIDQKFITTTHNVLILTEGKSDTKILKTAMNALYPEYEDLFQFADFDEFRIEGSASMLTKMVKTFAGVNIEQPIIALFDNDAAGRAEFEHLGAIGALPKNIKTMLLPNIEIAQSYPTIGPEGQRIMDINGSACSIELFLGRDSLVDQNERLQPVVWSGFHKQARRYQGAIENKEHVVKRFFKRMKKGGAPEDLRKELPELDLLLNQIFCAFH